MTLKREQFLLFRTFATKERAPCLLFRSRLEAAQRRLVRWGKTGSEPAGFQITIQGDPKDQAPDASNRLHPAIPTAMIGGGTWERAHARHEATRVHHAARRRGGVAASGARAAAGDAGDRVHERAVARQFLCISWPHSVKAWAIGASSKARTLPSISLGARRLSPAAKAGHGTRRPTGGRAPRGRRRCLSLGCESGDLDIPVVIGTGSDPVEAGFVASLNRPSGNVTGVSVLANQMEPKRLQLTARSGAGRQTGWCPPKSKLPACRTPIARA